MSLAEVFVYFAKCNTTCKGLGKIQLAINRKYPPFLPASTLGSQPKSSRPAVKFDLNLFLPSGEFVIYYNLAVHKESWDLYVRRIKAAFVTDALLFLVFVKVWRVLHDPNQRRLCLRERELIYELPVYMCCERLFATVSLTLCWVPAARRWRLNLSVRLWLTDWLPDLHCNIQASCSVAANALLLPPPARISSVDHHFKNYWPDCIVSLHIFLWGWRISLDGS